MFADLELVGVRDRRLVRVDQGLERDAELLGDLRHRVAQLNDIDNRRWLGDGVPSGSHAG